MDPSSSHLLLPAVSKIFQQVQPSDLSPLGQHRRPSPADEEEEEELDDELEAGNKNKKRRLTAKQVQCLEKSFEVDNKLEPDRKIKLAVELNLRPRQVAIWFQNRRARSKTKQLHRDYAALKSHYDQLINHNNQLQNEVSFLKDKLSKLESKSNTGAGGPAEEAISDVLDSGGSPSQEDLTASCLMEELGKALEVDFQIGAGAGGFGLPGFDFDPSYDAAYWSWLY